MTLMMPNGFNKLSPHSVNISLPTSVFAFISGNYHQSTTLINLENFTIGAFFVLFYRASPSSMYNSFSFCLDMPTLQ